jgi:hypothetical protein
MGSDVKSADRDPFDVVALADVIETVLKTALAPVVARVRSLETAIAGAADLTHVPGPPGPPGPPGADGLGFDDYAIAYDGERSLVHRWSRGDATIEHVAKMPNMIFRGVFVGGKVYERGDCVSHDGSIWHCNAETTTRPGDGGPAWTLAVKRGRDRVRDVRR